jgi:hypothetical protein
MIRFTRTEYANKRDHLNKIILKCVMIQLKGAVIQTEICYQSVQL